MKYVKTEHLVDDENVELVPIEYTAVKLSNQTAGTHKHTSFTNFLRFRKREEKLSMGIRILRMLGNSRFIYF